MLSYFLYGYTVVKIFNCANFFIIQIFYKIQICRFFCADYKINFKSVCAKRFIIIYDVTVVFAFPLLFFNDCVVFVNNLIKPVQKFFRYIIKFGKINILRAHAPLSYCHNSLPKAHIHFLFLPLVSE